MRWLITGGCGFIGTRLVGRILQDTTDTIRILDNLSVGTEHDLQRVAGELAKPSPSTEEADLDRGRVSLIVGDIRDSEAVNRAVRDVDVVVHLAANTGVIPSIESPQSDCENNVVGTLNVLEAMRWHHVPQFVFASSGAPLGEQTPPIHEEKVPRPVSPYGASKLAGEAYCHVYHGCFGLRTIALRFGNVYGPGAIHKGSVVAKFIKQAIRRETITIYGDGNQTRDFIYIDDLVDALVRAATLERGGQLFQIATGGETTVNDITEALTRALAEHQIHMRVQYAPARAGEVLRNFADVTRARTILGWEPKHSLEDGLRHTVDWFLEQNHH